MSRNKKPRKAYRPKPVTASTLELALHFAAKPSKQDREEVLSLLGSSVQALRQGVATAHDWSVAAGSVGVAQAIERRGIVRGLREHIETAEQALQSIHDRAMRTGQWHRTSLWFNEMDALANFLEIHTFQVDQLGRGEFLAAIEDAQKQTTAQGHTATVVRDLDADRMAA